MWRFPGVTVKEVRVITAHCQGSGIPARIRVGPGNLAIIKVRSK